MFFFTITSVVQKLNKLFEDGNKIEKVKID